MRELLLAGIVYCLIAFVSAIKYANPSPPTPTGLYCDELTRDSFDLLEFLTKYSGRLRYHGALETFKKCGTDSYDKIKSKLSTKTSQNSIYSYYFYYDRPGMWTKQNTIDGRAGDNIQNVQALVHYEENDEAFLITYACDCDGKYPVAFSLLTTSEQFLPRLDNIFSIVNPIFGPNDQIGYCSDLKIVPKKPNTRVFDRKRLPVSSSEGSVRYPGSGSTSMNHNGVPPKKSVVYN